MPPGLGDLEVQGRPQVVAQSTVQVTRQRHPVAGHWAWVLGAGGGGEGWPQQRGQSGGEEAAGWAGLCPWRELSRATVAQEVGGPGWAGWPLAVGPGRQWAGQGATVCLQGQCLDFG